MFRASELGEAERVELQRRCDRFASNIRTLAQSLEAEGRDGQSWSRILDLALTRPRGDWLFSVDDRPVLAMWGHVGPGEALLPDPAAPDLPQHFVAIAHMEATPSAVDVVEPMPGKANTPANAIATPISQGKGTQTGGNASYIGVGPSASKAAPRWLPATVGVFGLLTLALVAFAVWKIAGSGLWPGAGSLDARIAAAESRNTGLQAQLQARSGGAAQCRPDDPAPTAGQGTDSPPPAPVAVPPAAPTPAPASTESAPAAPIPAPPALPKMPELPRIPDLSGTPPASRTLQLPPVSGWALPPREAGNTAQALRPGHSSSSYP